MYVCVYYENKWIVAFSDNIRGPRQSLLIVRYCFLLYWSIGIVLFITVIIITTTIYLITFILYIICCSPNVINHRLWEKKWIKNKGRYSTILYHRWRSSYSTIYFVVLFHWCYRDLSEIKNVNGIINLYTFFVKLVMTIIKVCFNISIRWKLTVSLYELTFTGLRWFLSDLFIEPYSWKKER